MGKDARQDPQAAEQSLLVAEDRLPGRVICQSTKTTDKREAREVLSRSIASSRQPRAGSSPCRTEAKRITVASCSMAF